MDLRHGAKIIFKSSHNHPSVRLHASSYDNHHDNHDNHHDSHHVKCKISHKTVEKKIFVEKEEVECHHVPKEICEFHDKLICHDHHHGKKICEKKKVKDCHHVEKKVCEKHIVKVPEIKHIEIPV